MNDRAGIIDDVGDHRNDAVDLSPAVAQALDEHGDVVIRILPRLAARPQAEQHHALDPVAVQLSSAARKRLRIGSSEGDIFHIVARKGSITYMVTSLAVGPREA